MCFYGKTVDGVNMHEYASFTNNQQNFGRYCFLSTELADVEKIVEMIKTKSELTKIVYVGNCNSSKNIKLALNGFSLGISGFIFKSYENTEILRAFGYLFNPLYYVRYGRYIFTKRALTTL